MYIIAFAFISVFLGAFAEYIVESSIQGSKINSFGDALWWSIVTVTTVGYGDIYPITTLGRIIASILMIIGIMILGLFISTLGNSLIESRLNKFRNQSVSDAIDNNDENKNNKIIAIKNKEMMLHKLMILRKKPYC